MNSGNRKMKEVVGGDAEQTLQPPANNQFDFFDNPPGVRRFASPIDPPAGGSQSQVQKILNAAAAQPSRPFSFTSLLMANDEDDMDPLVAEIKSQSEQINQTILLHTDILRQALCGMLEKQHQAIHRAADERALQKLKQKQIKLQIKLVQNMELSRKAEHYRKEVERLQGKVEHLEQATMALEAWLDRASQARRDGGPALEDTNSSTYDDLDGVARPIWIDCRACRRQRATVMMWPCRHVCACSKCEGAMRTCPVCCTLKKMSIEIILPLDRGRGSCTLMIIQGFLTENFISIKH